MLVGRAFSYLDPPRVTIDELFKSIHDLSKTGNYAKIEAAYHPKLGYPTQVVFRTHKRILDGNSTVTITEFKDLAGQ
jgi:hypothetical protein